MILRNLRAHPFIHLSFLLLALWTIHSYFIYGGIPVDINDEPAHTFIEIPLYFRNLWQGSWLHINLFNAFGTPLSGDPVFIPWGLHTLTYAVFPSWVGMMVNKVLMLFLTLEALFAFGLYVGLGPAFAAWMAVASALNPSFFYFMNHHPHMGALLYFTFVLFTLEHYFRKQTLLALLLVAGSYLTLLTGVGVNGAVNAHLFLAGYLALSWRRVNARAQMALALTMAGALLVYLPHFISFLNWAPLTVRSTHRIFDLSHVGRYAWDTLLQGSLMLSDHLHMHIDIGAVQTLVILTLLVMALLASFQRETRASLDFKLFFFLGVLPTLAVYTLLVEIDWLLYIPFIKSTDITRLLWFSFVFVNLGLARYLEGYLSRRQHLRTAWPVVIALIASIVLFYLYSIDDPGSLAPFEAADFWLLSSSILALAVLALPLFWRVPPAAFGAMMAVLLLPKLAVFNFIVRPVPTQSSDYGLVPPRLNEFLTPYTRVASLFPFGESPDQRLAIHSVFGSGARSIILSGELKQFFLENHLVQEDTYSYSFRPDAANDFDYLGVNYVVSRDAELRSPKWIFKQALQYKHMYYVYQRFESATPVYCATRESRFLNPEFKGNTIAVTADNDCPFVVATFFHWPGWKVSVNGKDRPLTTWKLPFLVVSDLHKGDKVLFRFTPWWTSLWWFFALCGCGLIYVAVTWGLKRKTT